MTIETEEWRPIPGAPSHDVSSLGRVRLAGGILKPGYNGAGYRFMRLNIDGDKRRSHPVHYLVLLAFKGPRPSEIDGDTDVVCNHMDCDPKNNRPGNLEYTTNIANIFHGWAVRKGIVPRGTPAAVAMAALLRDKFLNECCTVCLSMKRIPKKKAAVIEHCSRCSFVARRCLAHGGERRHDGFRLGAWHDLLDHVEKDCAGHAELRRVRIQTEAMRQSAREAFGALQLGVAAL